MFQIHATAKIRFLDGKEMKRRLAESSGGFITANLEIEGIDQLLSVGLVLIDSEINADICTVGIGFLFPEKVKEDLRVNKSIVIKEGPKKKIAEGKIISILFES